MIDRIHVLSDSYIGRMFLEESLAGSARTIRPLASPSALLDMEIGDGEIVFWEVGDGAACAATLELLKADGARLDKIVLLLRAREQVADLRRAARDVGAVLAPDTPVEMMRRVLYPVDAGACVLPRDLLDEMILPGGRIAVSAHSTGRLTERERAILRRLSLGECNKMIAAGLEISDSTVRVHVRSILRKLGVKNRTQAALCAGQVC